MKATAVAAAPRENRMLLEMVLGLAGGRAGGVHFSPER
jgi:hypothetical protein